MVTSFIMYAMVTSFIMYAFKFINYDQIYENTKQNQVGDIKYQGV